MRRTLFLLLLICSLSFRAGCQGTLSRSELGVMAGGVNYIGDLNSQRLDGRLNPGVGIMGRYNLDDRWAVSAHLFYGRVEGGDPDVERWRNLSFRSHILETSVRMEFTFVPFGSSGYRFRTSPYLFVGVGLFHFNPQGYYTNPLNGESEWVDLQPLHTEGQGSDLYPSRVPYKLFQMCLPFGLGFKMALSKDVTLAVEYGYRMIWTDYLDDVSTTYVGSQLLGEGTVAAAMADRSEQANAVGVQRGDDSLDDAYAYINLSVTFNMETLFGWMRSKRCLK